MNKNNGFFKKLVYNFRDRRRLYYSRKNSKIYLNRIVRSKGFKVVNYKLKKRIKDYSVATYGSLGYYHWLVVYTELRGEFLEGWVPDDFFSYEMLSFLNPDKLSHISELKSFDSSLFKPHTIPLLGKVVNNVFLDANGREISPDLLFEKVKVSEKEIVIKKDQVPSGEGVKFILTKELTMNDFEPNTDYLIQPVVKQHKELCKIHYHSVSTVRITTFIDRKGAVNIKHRSLRFGIKKFRTVNHGGHFVFLDEKGNVESNIYNRIGLNIGETHPDTGLKLGNFKVPGVARAVRLCRKLHLRFPYLRFVAWDLYIDPDETPRIIEWNTIFPGMWENEAIIGPLWSSDEIDEVLEARHKN